MKPLTIPEILIDLDYNGLGLDMSDINAKLFFIYRGSDKLEYYFFYKNSLLFFGNDFKPSSLYCIDSLESMIDLLSFLSLQLGDTDKDYFTNYTKDQLAWTNSNDCEMLKLYVSDFEEKNQNAILYFTSLYEKLILL